MRALVLREHGARGPSLETGFAGDVALRVHAARSMITTSLPAG